MKIKVWLDSGANAFSEYSQEFDLEKDLGLDEDEWNAMSEQKKDDFIRPIAWDRMDWGYQEIE